jgi:putative membrane-bound dehydrogenase-like protein
MKKTFSFILSSLIACSIGQAKEAKWTNAEFLKPDEAIAKMDIPTGVEVKTFVSEPDISETIGFCFDDKGRLWTLENMNYQTRGKHSTDEGKNRIQIFEDTDGDGVFDTKKLFIDGLTFSSGLAVGFGGVYVGTPPNLLFIPDEDGDDKPDGKAEILLDGWGIRDRHETLNSFIWGPDGWLYGCHGVFTQSHVGKPGTPDKDRQYIDGGIWRFHPVKKEFEVFAEGLSNPWGFDFNDFGDGFSTGCVIPHLFHIIQGGIYDKQSKQNVNPYVYDNIKTIRDHVHKSAHGGARFYLADAFPEKYRDQLFMCNIHEHAILTDIMEKSGSGYIGKHGEDFIATNDKAWVGFSTEIGPEGGVYILDWHDQDICGNSVKFPNTSRIYRITPKGHKSPKVGDLRKMSDAQLVELQKHANDWYVRHARVILHERATKSQLDSKLVHAKLLDMLKTAKTFGKKLRALWALHVTGADQSVFMNGLNNSDEYIRAWSIQLLSEDKATTAAIAKFENMAKNDSSPIVRRYLASALQRMSYEQRWGILAALSKHGEDVKDHNIQKMVWLALEPMVETNMERALELAATSAMPKLQEFTARRALVPYAAVNTYKLTPTTPSVEKLAPGFKLVNNSIKNKPIYMESFRNKPVFQIYPKTRKLNATLYKQFTVPKGKNTSLQYNVSHQPHEIWQLVVKVNDKIILQQAISSDTVKDGWKSGSVDLSQYAGQSISLKVMNAEWRRKLSYGYFNELKVISK